MPGNHEFYNHDIGLTDELKATAAPNIHVLNNDKLELHGIRLLGSTLWTDFNLYGAAELEKISEGPTVVVTHHLPAPTSIAIRYANDSLNPAFASRLEDGIEKYRPELWIHGHTHVPCDYELFDTRIVCNTGDRNLRINAKTSAKVSGPLIVDLLKKAVHCI